VGYIYALVVIALIFVALHYFTELSHKQKITFSAILSGFVLFAYMYNTYKAHEQEKMYDIVVKYKQGKTIKCGKYDVNATNFSLSTGTYTFIGKENTPYYAVMVSAYNCQ
jgi:uncharacterized membrane protein